MKTSNEMSFRTFIDTIDAIKEDISHYDKMEDDKRISMANDNMLYHLNMARLAIIKRMQMCGK
jgi:hypothetical protein